MAIEFVNGYSVVNTTFQNKSLLISIDCLNREWTDNTHNTNNCMDYAFENCSSLLYVKNLSENITSMKGAFKNCSSMVEFPTFPNNITDYFEMFKDCSSLQSATISQSVTNLSQTFKNCSSLSLVSTIPSSVTNMYQTFDGCVNLPEIISITSSEITNASECFGNTTSDKFVYIPFLYSDHTYTTTYQSFRSAGYSTSVRKDGVILVDNSDYFPDVDLRDYDYTVDSNMIAHLTKYIGQSVRVIQPKI